MDELDGIAWLLLIGIAIGLQLMLIALAVHWGTAATRRELFEVRREIIRLGRD